MVQSCVLGYTLGNNCYVRVGMNVNKCQQANRSGCDVGYHYK